MTQHSDMIRLRHMLDHAKEAVDLDVLWDTIEIDLPPLIAEIEKIIGKAGEE